MRAIHILNVVAATNCFGGRDRIGAPSVRFHASFLSHHLEIGGNKMKSCIRVKHTGLLAVAAALTGLALAAPARGQILYDQRGPLVTDPGGGCAADPGLKNDSELQNQPAVCANLLGFGAQNTPNRVADDFTLSAPATITGFTFYTYQTGSPPGPPPTSTITGVYLQIWIGGPPGLGGAPHPDTPGTANQMSGTAWSTVYRSTEAGGNLDACNRPIMTVNATLTTPVSLPAGTYWVSWGLTGDGTLSGPWVPPLTVEGGPPIVGNGRQFTTIWAQAYDTGAAGCPGQPPAPGYSVEFPFQVLGQGQFCAADITGDLWVNVSDLLTVLNAWGTCPPPCPGDVTGDGAVNVSDLLAVINAWGSCNPEFELDGSFARGAGESNERNWSYCVFQITGSNPESALVAGMTICTSCPLTWMNACPDLVNCTFKGVPGNPGAMSTGVSATALSGYCQSCPLPEPPNPNGRRYHRTR